MRKKQKCKICGNRFYINKDYKYKVTETLGMTEIFNKTASVFDAIDCPKCGCQHILGKRFPQLT